MNKKFNMLSSSNKIFKKKKSRNKLKNYLSSKKKFDSSIKLNSLNSFTKNNINNFSLENIKSTNIFSTNNNTITNSNKTNFTKLINNIGRKFSNSETNTVRINKKKNIFEITKRITEFSGRFFDKLSDTKKSSNRELELNDEKICLLPNYLKVKNFCLKTPKVMDYLELNKDTIFFKCKNYKPKLYKLKTNNNLYESQTLLKRSGSFTPCNKYIKIEDIYPTVFNIEGQKNRKLLEILELTNKKKRKKGNLNEIMKQHVNQLKQKMIKEKNKVEDENYKSNVSDFTYKRQLMLSKLKFFKKDLNHLRRKNSFKYHLELPLYNLFLNLDY